MPVIKIKDSVFEFEGCVNVGEVIKGIKNIEMPCGGHGKCGKCKVYVKGKANDLTENEKRLLSEDEIKRGIRLLCSLYAEGDIEITLSDSFGKAEIITDGFMPEFIIDTDFQGYGAAIDIGTTTVCARLYGEKGRLISESSCLNSQKSFGADVISRIEAGIKGEGALLSRALRENIDFLLSDMAGSAKITVSDINSLVITGNTAMLHFLTDTDVEPLAKAPFEAKRLFGEVLLAKDIGINYVNSDARVYLPPCVSAFVGADTVCALLASDILEKDGVNLLADIGTNGEIALCRDGKITVCSTAAGPAFEGAYLKSGMMGRSGAIDRVWLENGKIAFHVIGDVKPLGICGSGIIDAVQTLLFTEDIEKSGYMEEDVTLSEGVFVTKDDVRAIQLAKSAVVSGIYTLLKEEGLSFSDVDSLSIAGGFGSRINLSSAEGIGLLPKGAKKKSKAIGNGALAGAAMLLLNKELRDKCDKIIKSAKTIELSDNAFFIDKYVENMMF